MLPNGNLFRSVPPAGPDEAFEPLANGESVLVERIVSHGHSTPGEGWLVQDRHEWVALLKGKARLELRDGGLVDLSAGDYLLIPGGTEHRVVETDPGNPTIWIAVHFDA
jgi:cupin 2 domain-containing protein